MHPRIGDRIQPMAELTIEVVKIAEGAAEEEVLADVSERPLDLAVGLGPIGPAGARLEAIMASEIDERAVVDHEPLGVLAEDGGLHSVVEDLARNAADRLQSGAMTAKNCLQILMDNEARPDQP